MLRRRLRGPLAFAAGGALVGSAAGVALGLLFFFAPGPKTITVQPQFPGAVFAVPAAWGAVIGAMSGVIGGVLLMLARRGAERSAASAFDVPQ